MSKIFDIRLSLDKNFRNFCPDSKIWRIFSCFIRLILLMFFSILSWKIQREKILLILLLFINTLRKNPFHLKDEARFQIMSIHTFSFESSDSNFPSLKREKLSTATTQQKFLFTALRLSSEKLSLSAYLRIALSSLLKHFALQPFIIFTFFTPKLST